MMSREEEARLSEELEARKDTDAELDGFAPVKLRTVRQPRSVLSLRLGPGELELITRAAGVMQRNVSEFIREAALKEALQVEAGVAAAREMARREAGA